ncbi:MAG: cell division protein FtsQ/DivIB [Micrococcus sp.]|nr:cell division protein FtsQ/DivIB [Micrococcus sp.]
MAGSRTEEGREAAAPAGRPSGGDDNVLAFPETPEKARRRRVRLWWVGGAAGLALLLVLGAVLYFSPLLAIRTITVTGTDLLPQDRAEELLHPLHGVPLPQVGQRTVAELLAGEAAVDEVRVRAEPPASLAVEIVEHQPVAQVPQGGERVLYSAQGHAVATLPAEEAERYRLPNVSDAADLADPEVFDAITTVLGSLPDPIRDRMESASARTVDSVTLTLEDGRTVLWGNAEHGTRKAQVLTALLKVPQDEADPVTEFDVSTPDHPVTR